MDLETENRLAALLMEEARRLRLQAEKEGVHVYLRQPNVRGRPNSRFLTATVLGVEQANRAAEVGEMWRAREKELELDSMLKGREKDKCIRRSGEKHHRQVISSLRHEEENGSCSGSAYCSSSKCGHEDSYSSDNGVLSDEELEEFLRSRVKRGRGAIGSRMDEPGPYPSSTYLDQDDKFLVNPDMRVKEEWERHIVLGPEKPSFLKKSHEPPPEEAHDTEVSRGIDARSSKKSHSRGKKRSKDERWSERRKSKEKKKSKHHKSRRRSGGDSE